MTQPSSPHEQPLPPDALQEELVAYLDGELDAQAASRVEQRLAHDAQVREELARLERTWELLDSLGRATTDETFTQTTLEMVAAAASEEVAQQQAELPRRQRRKWLLRIGGLLAAGAAGFLVAALASPDPNRQLLEDLPILENLDQYRHAGDIEFLRLLHREGLFPAPEPGAQQDEAAGFKADQ